MRRFLRNRQDGLRQSVNFSHQTVLTRWLSNGLSEYDVINLAGHAEFETTRRFYLAVREDLLKDARAVSAEVMNDDFVAHLLRPPFRA